MVLPNHNMIFSCIFYPSTNTGLGRVKVDLFLKFFCIFSNTKNRHRPDFSQCPFGLAKQKAPTFLRLMPFGLLTILFYKTGIFKRILNLK